MNKYTVICLNTFTNKTMKRNVQAASVAGARNKAVSDHMMANAWGVAKVVDSNGVETNYKLA